MNIRHKKPYSPGTRGARLLIKNDIKKTRPLKRLSFGFSPKSGRNNQGKTTVWHKGGRHKRKYRIIDFYRSSFKEGFVTQIEYDPNRTANIALIKHSTNKFVYIIAPEGLKKGDFIQNQEEAPVQVGNSLPISRIPLKTKIYNINNIKSKNILVRSAGCSASILEKDPIAEKASLKLPSGKIQIIDYAGSACVGEISNKEHRFVKLGKAGRNRNLGKKPTTRGVAMNPIDHPHGGNTSIGRPSVTPWGHSTK
jgi:large subunit ribosomal protein L2